MRYFSAHYRPTQNGRRVSLSQMTATMFSTIPRTENCDFKCGVQMKIDQLNTMVGLYEMFQLIALSSLADSEVINSFLANMPA